MKFFKTKEEKRIEEEMMRDEQMEIFSNQIQEIQLKKNEYAKIAAEAEINGDNATYDIAVNNLLELNEVVSSLIQTKANFDIINVSNSITVNMPMAVNALNNMASGSNRMPNLRKIQKVNVKVAKYMRQIKISKKAMGSMMTRVNPANRARSEEEIASIRPLIDAARSKLVGTTHVSSLDLSSEIEAEKNRTII